MKIKLLKDCLVGGQHCPVGEVVDVSEQDGRYLVARGHAKAENKAKAKKSTVKHVTVIVARTCLIGGAHVNRGDVIKAVEADAKYLLGHGDAFIPDSDAGKALKATVKKEAYALDKAAAEATERESEAQQQAADEAAEAASDCATQKTASEEATE